MEKKTIETQEVITKTKTLYIAKDNKVFNDERICSLYEDLGFTKENAIKWLNEHYIFDNDIEKIDFRTRYVYCKKPLQQGALYTDESQFLVDRVCELIGNREFNIFRGIGLPTSKVGLYYIVWCDDGSGPRKKEYLGHEYTVMKHAEAMKKLKERG